MSLQTTNKLKWFNLIDKDDFILGIAIIKKGFIAQLHHHHEKENYYFLYGTGKLRVGAETKIVSAYKKIKIPGNTPHAMTPISDFVLLAYTFRKGPFKKIRYYYHDSKL